jgi:hypothetical protein
MAVRVVVVMVVHKSSMGFRVIADILVETAASPRGDPASRLERSGRVE